MRAKLDRDAEITRFEEEEEEEEDDDDDDDDDDDVHLEEPIFFSDDFFAVDPIEVGNEGVLLPLISRSNR